jgi:spermidine synthase
MPGVAQQQREPRSFSLLVTCFFASGLAALIYQTAWTREFSFVFGTSELAIATVLAAYMGGLATGAAIAARWAGHFRRPVLVYGLLELGIAVSALAVPFGIQIARALYLISFGEGAQPSAEGGLVTALFYLCASFLILLVPTSLMGATLPLLASHAVRRDQEIGSHVGLLYAFNTAGAVVGTVLTGFFLLPAFGLHATIAIAIAANAGVFAVAALLATRVPALRPQSNSMQKTLPRRRPGGWILPVIMASGTASFAYEVLWSRMLGHVLGGSSYAFSTMLATFLTGIALGSWAASRVATTQERSIRLFAWAQLGTGLLFLLAFQLVDHLPRFTQSLATWNASTPVLDAMVCALVLLPGTLCIGATFPLAVRIFAREAAATSEATGKVYSWNTLGSIFGAVGAGFFLIPAVGYTVSIQVMVVANLFLAGLSAVRAAEGRRLVPWLASASILALILIPPNPPWELLRNTPLSAHSLGGKLTYFGVGRSSTVMLRDRQGRWYLSTNGLPESVILPPGGLTAFSTASQWLTNAAILARPEMRSLLLVGLGGGVTLENIPDTVREIDVIEIEPEVVLANRAVGKQRSRDPLADPRVRLTINDVRSALLLSQTHYDAIISQPSHPWTAGASHLYTREFFGLARDHLTESGVFVQWLGLGYIDADLLRILVATLLDAFTHVRVYQPTPGDLLLLASEQPLDLTGRVNDALKAAPHNLARLGISGPEDIAATWLLDTDSARRFAAGAPLNTDDHNHLQARSPRLARGGAKKTRIADAASSYDLFSSIPDDWNAVYLTRRTAALGFPDRAQRIAEAIPDSEQQRLAQGLVAYSLGDWNSAIQLLEQSLAADPNLAEAHIALWRMGRKTNPPAASASSNIAALMEGWELRRKGDWTGLRQMDFQLAASNPHDPEFFDASELRAQWRVEVGDEEHAREALRLIDQMGPLIGGPSILLTRARAAVLAHHNRGALQTLFELSFVLKPNRGQDRRIAKRAISLLDQIPPRSSPPGQLKTLRGRLERIAVASNARSTG